MSAQQRNLSMGQSGSFPADIPQDYQAGGPTGHPGIGGTYKDTASPTPPGAASTPSFGCKAGVAPVNVKK